MDDPKTIVALAEVPALPLGLQRVMALSDADATSGAALETLVAREPGLTAHVLRLVNSAYYGMPQKISSLGQAIVLLGFSSVKALASALMMTESINKLSSGINRRLLPEVRSHALASTAVVRVVGKVLPPRKRDELFLAAIVHDLGHLILQQHFFMRYKELLPPEGGLPTPEAERSTLGVDHAQIGAELLREWKFNDAIVELVEHHHDCSAEAPREQKALALCDALAEQPGGLMKTLEAESESSLAAELRARISASGLTWAELLAGRPAIEDALGELGGAHGA